MGTNQVLLEQPAPPRTASALETDYRVRDAVGIELLHSPRRNSMRHNRTSRMHTPREDLVRTCAENAPVWSARSGC